MKKYQIIYADPPWKYDFSKSDSRQIENQYPTMELQAIKDLVYDIPSDTNCVLYLWATAPKLREALEVMEAWGFEYKSHMVWDKQIIGMGYWFRGQHELLLVGTKGKVSPPPAGERFSSVYSGKREGHSKKPLSIRGRITDSFPADWNRLEMFAREKTSPSWDYWGNEVESNIKLAA